MMYIVSLIAGSGGILWLPPAKFVCTSFAFLSSDFVNTTQILWDPAYLTENFASDLARGRHRLTCCFCGAEEVY